MKMLLKFHNRLRVQQTVVKTKAFCRWREVVKELSLTFEGSSNNSALHQQSIIKDLLSKF